MTARRATVSNGDGGSASPGLIAELVDELAVLRRGRGLYAPDVHRRVGPRLYAVADPSAPRPDGPATTDTILRDGLVAALDEVARALPRDLRFAALTALAARPELGSEMLTDRIDRVARFLERDRRTARRRVDEALILMAEALAAKLEARGSSSPDAPTGWFVDTLHSRLTFDPTPRLVEHREVVATVDGLQEITVNLSMPSAAGDRSDRLRLQAEQGCSVLRTEQISASYWRYVIGLPAPLRAGESARYVVSFVASSREAMMPYYVLIPLRRCRHFSAEVVFNRPDDVELLWRLDGIPVSLLEDFVVTPSLLRLDERNRVYVAFDDVQQGLCYGVQWRWAA